MEPRSGLRTAMRRAVRIGVATCVVAVVLCSTVASAAFTVAELIAVRDGFEARRDAMMRRQLENTYPALKPNADYQLFAWNKLGFALSALYLGERIDEANAAIIAVCERGDDKRIGNGEPRFHWIAPLLIRAHELFREGSPHLPGRLTPEAEKAIREVLWKYLRDNADIGRYALDRVWHFQGSENHDEQYVSTAWGAAKILSEDPDFASRATRSGSSPVTLFKTIDAFVKHRFRERIGKGLLVEKASPTYGKYTLSQWYNYFDFGDPELRGLADAALAVYWTDWAQEQHRAVRGGAKARCYKGVSSEKASGDGARMFTWLYMGIGQKTPHPGVWCLLTSAHRLPLVTMDIAFDTEARGRYEATSYCLGLRANRDPRSYPPARRPDHMNHLDPETCGLYRYTWVTPAFTIGSWMLEKRLAWDWIPLSSQNRWEGVVFNDSDADARLFPDCGPRRNGKTYNQFRGVQNKGTLIVCRLPEPDFGRQVGNMRVFFSSGLTRTERGDFVFAESERAYAAVRKPPSSEPAVWEGDNWLVFGDTASDLPVVIEVAEKRDFPDFAAFQRAVETRPCAFQDGVLTYEGLGESGAFRFDTRGARLPEINGKPILLTPTHAHHSPFMHIDWKGRTVRITKDGREKVYDLWSLPRP